MNQSWRRREIRRLEDDLARRRSPELADDFDPVAALKSAYQEEMERHPSLINIIDLPTGDPARHLDSQSLLDRFGYGEYRLVKWETNQQDGDYGARDLADGGFMISAKRPLEEISTFVFIHCREGTGDEARVRAYFRLVSLYHETGHVDDLETQTNYRDGALNLAATETYAHDYACKRLIDKGYRFILAWYLKEVVRQQVESPFRLIRQAGLDFQASVQYQQYVRFAGPHMELTFSSEPRQRFGLTSA